MNYLAHLFLSFDHPEVMLGNFIADDLGKGELAQLPDHMLSGVMLHKAIDRFTDQHTAFKEATVLLRSHHGKYAPVVLDILNDHLLCRNWMDLSNVEFDNFGKRVYATFEELVDRLPRMARSHTQSLLDYKYLRAYETFEGISDVLIRMDRKTRFPSDFKSAAAQLYKDYNRFDELFVELIRDLIQHVRFLAAGSEHSPNEWTKDILS